MKRGLLSGVFWGLGASAVALSSASLLAPLPDRTSRRAGDLATVSGAGTAPDQAGVPEDRAAAADVAREAAASATSAQATQGAEAPSMAEAPAAAATETGETVQTSEAATASQEPSTPAPEAQPDATATEPAAEEASAPETAAEETAADETAAPAPAETATVEAPAPQVESAEVPGALTAPETTGGLSALPEGAPSAGEDASPTSAAAAVAPAKEPPAAEEPLSETAAAPAPRPPVPEVATAAVTDPGGAALSEAPLAPEGAPSVETAPVEVPAEAAPLPDATAESEPQPEAAPEAPVVAAPAPVETEPGASEDAQDASEVTAQAQPGIGEPAGLDGEVEGVETDRLPRIFRPGSGEDTPSATPEAEAGSSAEDVAEAVEAIVEDLPALTRYAIDFENPAGLPLFAIVVVDLGPEAGGIDRPPLGELAFPISVAVPADRADAGDAAAYFRAVGHEVVLMATGLPAAAQPADLEVAFESYRGAVPGAVAVLDPPEGGFQGNRAQARQVVEILKEEGYGLLALDRGLNMGQQVAEREGLPSALIFREVGAAGESEADIRRTLDRAAFRAAQEGSVIVLAPSRQEVVSALRSWAEGAKDGQVVLAPVSAVLRGR